MVAVFLHHSKNEERCGAEAAGCLGDAWVEVPHGRQCDPGRDRGGCQLGCACGKGCTGPLTRWRLAVHSEE